MNARPLGITIIAIVLAFGGVVQILTGVEVLGITKFGLASVAESADISGWGSIIGGVLTLVVAGGLFTLASWAWLLTVVVMAIRIGVDVFAVITHGSGSTLWGAAITNLILSAVVLVYFQRGNVRAAFGR